MTSSVEKKEHNIVRLSLDFSPEEFKHGLDFAYKKNAKRFSVPGFRPGKAPMAVALRYYGEGVLYDDAIDHVVNHAYGDALKEHSLEPVSRPGLEVEEVGLDKGLKIVLELTVKPEVQLGTYKGVEAVRREEELKEEDVNRELERVRERNSRMISVEDRPVQEGDTANIDYEGFLDGVPFAGGEGKDHDLRIGSKSFIPGFEDQVIGKNVGDEFEVHVTFPEEYHAEELKGKAVVFNVVLNGIQVKELPELDDEFAKDVSEFDTLEEYKNSIRSKQRESLEKTLEKEFEDHAIRAAVDNATVEIPAVMIDDELNSMIEQQDRQLQQSGLNLEQYLNYLGQTMTDYRAQYREAAENRVKTTLVLETVANVEAFEIADEEIEAEIVKMAEGYKMDVDELKKNVGDDMKDYISHNLQMQKALNLIRDHALPVAPAPVIDVPEQADENQSNDENQSDTEA